MPDLPTLTLSGEHFARVVDAFPGDDSATKAEAYRRWLVNRLIERVQLVETRRLDEEAFAARNVAMQALLASLPPHQEEPAIL